MSACETNGLDLMYDSDVICSPSIPFSFFHSMSHKPGSFSLLASRGSKK